MKTFFSTNHESFLKAVLDDSWEDAPNPVDFGFVEVTGTIVSQPISGANIPGRYNVWLNGQLWIGNLVNGNLLVYGTPPKGFAA